MCNIFKNRLEKVNGRINIILLLTFTFDTIIIPSGKIQNNAYYYFTYYIYITIYVFAIGRK